MNKKYYKERMAYRINLDLHDMHSNELTKKQLKTKTKAEDIVKDRKSKRKK